MNAHKAQWEMTPDIYTLYVACTKRVCAEACRYFMQQHEVTITHMDDTREIVHLLIQEYIICP